MMARSVRGIACAALLAASVPLHAATCGVSANSVAFGAYNPFDLLPHDAAGNIQVSCNDVLVALSYTLRLSAGGSGSYAPRRMSGGAYTLDYNLYTDPAHATVWGDGSASTATVTGAFAVTVSGSANHAVYGRVPAGQNAGAGSYSDTVTVTVEY